MTFGSLFAGIGGMDLGLERSGMRCKWQCEIDPFARRVLAKHWPDVPKHDDVRTFPPHDGDWSVDLIAGGFPCQDISYAGKGAGLAGERSGLWYEFARVVREIRPRYVLVENVAALLVRGLDAVLGTLASLGYDAEWSIIPAAAVGAPHLRERLFIVANNESFRVVGGRSRAERPGGSGSHGSCPSMAHIDSDNGGTRGARRPPGHSQGKTEPALGAVVADVDRSGLAFRSCFGGNAREELATFERANRQDGGWWASEPDVVRVVHGVSTRVVEPRIRGLGNAVVPQVAEWIGRRIMTVANGGGS